MTIGGTKAYMAPEISNDLSQKKDKNQRNSFKSDVFSFGLIILELGTLNAIKRDLNKEKLEKKILTKIEEFDGNYMNQLEDFDKKDLKMILKILKKCLQYNSEERPDFLEILRLWFGREESKENVISRILFEDLKNGKASEKSKFNAEGASSNETTNDELQKRIKNIKAEKKEILQKNEELTAKQEKLLKKVEKYKEKCGILKEENYPSQTQKKDSQSVTKTTKYDMIVKINSLTAAALKGWEVVLNRKEKVERCSKNSNFVVGVIGHRNVGKTFVINKLLQKNFATGAYTNTEELKIYFYDEKNEKNIVVIEVATDNTILFYQQKPQDHCYYALQL